MSAAMAGGLDRALDARQSDAFCRRREIVHGEVAGIAGMTVCCGSRMETVVSAIAEICAPASERAGVDAVRVAIGSSLAEVHVRVGREEVVLPPSLVRVLLAAAVPLHDGETVAVVRAEAEISPAQAAKLLGVSRQYVDRLVAADLLPSRRLPGSTYRKIPAGAVLTYKRDRERKRAGIRRIVDDAVAAGLDY